ncbi:MAG: glycosyltransferase family 39 protein [Planctomycetia bacterium]|nr:glycosyltransferase family 39 protein [Planctomycetia bacterium]
MASSTGHRATWILIIAVAVALRLAAGVWWQSRLPAEQPFYFGDSASYWTLGKTIAHGEPYQYESPEARVFRTPGYPLLLAGLFSIFGDDAPVMMARALSAVLGGLAVAVVGWWTTRLFDHRTGRCAGWIAAFYPGAISMGAFVLSEAPFCPLMLLQLALWGLAWRAPSNERAIILALAGGVAGAFATLVRPSWLLFTPCALLVALAFDKYRLRQGLVGIAMCASFVLGMLPWWIRNLQVTGHFVVTTLQVGASLYDGLNPTADGGSNMNFVPRFAAQQHVFDAMGAEADFEYRLNRRLQRAAVDWAVANPARVAELAWIKFVRIWNVWPNEPSLRTWPMRLAVCATYAPLLCVGIFGAWRFTRRGWPYLLAWLPAVYFTLVHLVFVGSLRYREPAMLALAVLAAGALASLTQPPPQTGAAIMPAGTGPS